LQHRIRRGRPSDRFLFAGYMRGDLTAPDASESTRIGRHRIELQPLQDCVSKSGSNSRAVSTLVRLPWSGKSRVMPDKTKECLLQTRSKRSQQSENWPSCILVNTCLTCEHMEIIRKSIQATDTCSYSHLGGRALHPPHERGIRGNKLRKRE